VLSPQHAAPGRRAGPIVAGQYQAMESMVARGRWFLVDLDALERASDDLKALVGYPRPLTFASAAEAEAHVQSLLREGDDAKSKSGFSRRAAARRVAAEQHNNDGPGAPPRADERVRSASHGNHAMIRTYRSRDGGLATLAKKIKDKVIFLALIPPGQVYLSKVARAEFDRFYTRSDDLPVQVAELYRQYMCAYGAAPDAVELLRSLTMPKKINGDEDKKSRRAAAPAPQPESEKPKAKRGRPPKVKSELETKLSGAVPSKRGRPKAANPKPDPKAAVGNLARKLILSHPNWDNQRVLAKLQQKFPDVSVMSIVRYRSKLEKDGQLETVA
jgi:hypothetical protein